MLVYMDLCCFNRPFDEQSHKRILFEAEAKMIIQDLIQNGKVRLIWSYMVEYENTANPDLDVMASIAEWKQKSWGPCIEEEPGILEAARILRGIGLGVKDALHVACALKAKAEYFITTDKGILHKRDAISNIRIINPVEFILMEGDTL